MKYERIITEKGRELVLTTRKLKHFQELLDSGAIILEKGVVLKPKYNIREDELLLPNSNIITNSKPLLPYFIYDDAYYPIEKEEEIPELFYALKKYASIREDLDIRQYEDLKERIDMFQYNMFYGRTYNKTSAKFKSITCFLWTITGTLNAMNNKLYLSILNYLCAALQIDYFTLVPMIMASTISNEKKKYLLETIKKHYINPEAIDKKDKYVGLYTRINAEDNPRILSKIR